MSVITFGTSYVGKVDRVPGKFYLVTEVFQVINLPLLPLRGFIVYEGSEQQSFVRGLYSFKGHEVPIDFRSFAWGVVRAAWFIVALLASMGILLIEVAKRLPLTPVSGFLLGPPLGIALFVGWWRTRHGLPASAERARVLEGLLNASAPAPGTQGAHVRTVLRLTPLQAAMGMKTEVPVEHPEPCDSCAANVANAVTKCTECGGTGWFLVQRNLLVTVPPGIEHGQTLRLKHQGIRSLHGPPGHLFVEIEVAAEGQRPS